MNELIDLATKILDNCCSNPVDWEAWEESNKPRPIGEPRPAYTGWNEYYIETHCVAWRVIARKRDGQWEIKSISGEDC
jgi:hypothetical protein